MDAKCVHSCRGLCSALEVAEKHEQDAINEYRAYAASCDYPDVREVLETLIKDRERALAVLKEKKDILTVKFSALEKINDSFA
ncbi:MAG TPA: hypothetical protein VEO56_08010 [Bacteroidota bacterium]|nr:hypothetical protein [Bacteroidota bacterium]